MEIISATTHAQPGSRAAKFVPNWQSTERVFNICIEGISNIVRTEPGKASGDDSQTARHDADLPNRVRHYESAVYMKSQPMTPLWQAGFLPSKSPGLK